MRVIIALLVATYSLDIRATSEERYRPVAEVLPELKICNVTDKTALAECIADAIESMSTYLAEGVEELDIPSLEPYYIPQPYEHTFAHDGYKGYAKVSGIKITGMSRYYVTDFKLLDSVKTRPKVSFVAHFTKIHFWSRCYLNGTLGSPVHVNDVVQLSVRDLEVRINGSVSLGKQHEYFSLPTVNLYFSAHGVKFSVGNEKNSPLTTFQKNYLHRDRASVWFQLVPNLEWLTNNLIMKIVTNVFSNFKVEDLLPTYYSLY